MKEASTDKTYCINEKCKNKCWRYKDNYIFKEDVNYWFMERCEEYSEKEG